MSYVLNLRKLTNDIRNDPVKRTVSLATLAALAAGTIFAFGVFSVGTKKTTAANPAPADIIVMWPSASSTIPAGWYRDESFDGFFVSGTTTDAGSGFAATPDSSHTHTAAAHTHTQTATHSHTGNPSLANSSGSITAGTGVDASSDAHTNTVPDTDSVADGTTGDETTGAANPTETSAATHEPPSREVIFIRAAGGTEIPDGALALFNSATPPAGYTASTTDGGIFYKGAAAGADPGADGGTKTHTHTYTHDHNQPETDHANVTSGAGPSDRAGRGGTPDTAVAAHTHTIDFGVSSHNTNTDDGGTEPANHVPSHIGLLAVENTSGGPSTPDNILALWTGNAADIPENWVLCQSGGSCNIDVANRFLMATSSANIGTTGGAATHDLPAAAHSHANPTHTHTVTAAGISGTTRQNQSGSTAATDTHTHTGNPATSAGGDVSTDVATIDFNSNTDENMPAYTGVMVIQYQEPPLLELTEHDFRWYENVDAIQPVTPLAAENATATAVASGGVVRLRTNISVTGSPLATSSKSFKLTFAELAGAGECTAIAAGNFLDVGELGSTTALWRGAANTPDDGATTTATLLASSEVNESYEEANPTVSNLNAIPAGEEGEWDFVLQNNAASSGTTYCFRIVESDGTVLDGYTRVAALTTLASATWRQPENTADSIGVDTDIRLRIQVDNDGTVATTSSLRLEYASSTAGPWRVISPDAACTSAEEAFRICTSDNFRDGDPTTNRLSAPGGSSFVSGFMLESSNPAPNVTLQTGEFTEVEWKLQASSSSVPGSTYYFRVSEGGSSVGTYTAYPQLTVTSSDPLFSQNYFRFYVDNDALLPADPWPEGGADLGENAGITTSDGPPGIGERVRIRTSLAVSGTTTDASSKAFTLQYGARSSTCDAITEWLPAGGIGSTTATWRGFNGTPADGTALSGDPPTVGDLVLSVSDAAGTYEEENDSALNPFEILVGEDVEYDWVVENASVSGGTTYCFRMVKSGGAELDGYTFYPTVASGVYSPESADWKWFDDEENETPTSALAATSTAPVDVGNGNVVKLRMVITETGGAAGENAKFKLQFSENSDFSANVFDVVATSTCAGGSLWCYADGAGEDNATITTRTIYSADACSGGAGDGCGTHNEATTTIGGFAHPANANTEFEFTLRHDDARANTVYFFRAYDLQNDAPVAASSTPSYPSLSTEGAALSFSIGGLPAGTTTEGVATDVATTPTGVAFGSLSIDAEIAAAQRLSVSTNATNGYQVFAFGRQGLLRSGGHEIAPVQGTNAEPLSWSAGCSSTSSGCYGYHAGDDVLEGGSTRFAADDTYARFSQTSEEIAHNATSTPAAGEETDIVYKLQVRDDQEAGGYESSVAFVVVASF